jgi:YD repeat-containing protein
MEGIVNKFWYKHKILTFVAFILIFSTSMILLGSNNVNYTYDELHRLKTATYPDGTMITYTYDQLGNRTSMQVNGVIPTIQVTEPNGAETWTIGTTQNIQWTSDNVIGNVNISLSRDNGTTWVETLFADSPNDGIEQWEVTGEVSSQCLIRIESAVDPNIYDTSDTPFSIIPGESTITLLSPNGGEIMEVDSQHTITWQSDPTVGDVKIEYSIDNGTSWEIITPTAPNNGQYPWNIFEPVSTQCLVKISETDGSPSDISDAVFSIVYPASVLVTSPNGGEVWEAGTSQTISWDASGNISQVDVSILRPGDITVFTQTFFSNPGSTTWDIPTDMSGIFFARVRIIDNIGNQYEDTSNEYFNVVDPSTVDDPFAVPEVISNLSQTPGEVDMAVDPANNLHAAWSDNFNLFYLQKTSAGWGTIDQLTTNNQVKTNGENHVLIDVGIDNRPHIIYKSTNDDLYYTYNSGTNFTSPVNITNSGNVVWYRMAMDTNNNIHLIFRDTSYQVHYRKISGGAIDNSASATLWTTCGDSVGIAVASPAEIYAFRRCDGISYKKFNNGSWGASQTLTATPGDGYPCAEVDSSGTVHLTWRTSSGQNTGLWYASLNSQSVFSNPTLISTFLGLPKLTLDKNDFPVVSNRMSISGNIHMTIIKKTNSGWINKIVSTNSQSANDPGPVAVDSNNIIHVLYTGWEAGSMAVFYTSGSACGIDTFILSGTVTSGGTGVQNVAMNGLPGSPTTDSEGYYTAIVNCGWSGTVTPTLTGYTFTEVSTTYTNVTSNQTTNYTATLLGFTISGTVSSGGSGLANVVMTGLPGNPVTDSGGNYAAAVDYGWSGTVTPTLAGYSFTESSTTYTNVTADQTTNYTATLMTYTISGNVTLDGSGLESVVMDGLPGNPVSNTEGFYTATVNYDWSGTVTPTLEGCIFTEPSTTYTNVTSNQTTHYTAALLTYTISGTVTLDGSGLENVVMNGLPGNPVTDSEGFYTASVNHGWSGTVTPTLTGYIFTEPSTTYTNITSNQTTNYTAALLISAIERNALIDLYNSTSGDNWTNNSGWKDPPLHTDGFATPGSEGTWYGITLDNSGGEAHVTRIELGNNNLTGTIPNELSNLSQLKCLNFFSNQLSGSIPLELGNLSNLEILTLGLNSFEQGPIPAWVVNLDKLEILRLDSNNLIGPIPNELGQLDFLISLNLANNSLSGEIPIELGDLSNLEYLYLYNNNLDGGIPEQLANLTKLRVLDLEMNQLSDSFPYWVVNLRDLRNLNLGDCDLTGNIPSDIGNLTYLNSLVLSDGQLTGTIPPEIGMLTSLSYLRINNNKLSGGIPWDSEFSRYWF